MFIDIYYYRKQLSKLKHMKCDSMFYQYTYLTKQKIYEAEKGLLYNKFVELDYLDYLSTYI